MLGNRHRTITFISSWWASLRHLADNRWTQDTRLGGYLVWSSKAILVVLYFGAFWLILTFKVFIQHPTLKNLYWFLLLLLLRKMIRCKTSFKKIVKQAGFQKKHAFKQTWVDRAQPADICNTARRPLLSLPPSLLFPCLSSRDWPAGSSLKYSNRKQGCQWHTIVRAYVRQKPALLELGGGGGWLLRNGARS